MTETMALSGNQAEDHVTGDTAGQPAAHQEIDGIGGMTDRQTQ